MFSWSCAREDQVQKNTGEYCNVFLFVQGYGKKLITLRGGWRTCGVSYICLFAGWLVSDSDTLVTEGRTMIKFYLTIHWAV